MAVELKSAPEIDRMRRAGRVVAEILDALEAAVAPGVTTWELDQLAERLIKEKGAQSRLQGLPRLPGGPLRVRQPRGRPRHPEPEPEAGRRATS